MKSFLMISVLLFTVQTTYAAKQEITPTYEKLDKKISKQADMIRKLKQENTALKKVAKNKLKPSNEKRAAKVNSEKALYLQFKQSFKQGEKKNYRKALRLLAKNYPNSQYFANVYYLAGRSALVKKNYKVALRSFNKVLKKYPKSKIASQAKYSKGYTYQQMNLAKQASFIYKDLLKRYPNTSLANKANLQLKNLAKNAKATKASAKKSR